MKNEESDEKRKAMESDVNDKDQSLPKAALSSNDFTCNYCRVDQTPPSNYGDTWNSDSRVKNLDTHTRHVHYGGSSFFRGLSVINLITYPILVVRTPAMYTSLIELALNRGLLIWVLVTFVI
jgi:hypothetical protein